MKSCEIHLGYFKQGDDLHACIADSKSPAEALKAHSEIMTDVAKHLAKVHDLVACYPPGEIELDADTHYIGLTGPDALVDELIKQELAEAVEEEEDEDDPSEDCEPEP